MSRLYLVPFFAAILMPPAIAECTFSAEADGDALTVKTSQTQTAGSRSMTKHYVSGAANVAIEPNCVGECSGRVEVDFEISTNSSSTNTVTVEWPWSSNGKTPVTVQPQTARLECDDAGACSVSSEIGIRLGGCAQAGDD